MLYIGKDDLEIIFGIIAEHYTNQEEIPNYSSEEAGIEKLLGVYERVKMNHYTTLIDKVVYLFIQINKGHFFSNGNKRLALVSSIGFLFLNEKEVKQLTREEFKKILISLFPLCESDIEDHEEFNSGEFALYNLSIIVADSHKYLPEGDFNMLKQKVSDFFNQIVDGR